MWVSFLFFVGFSSHTPPPPPPPPPKESRPEIIFATTRRIATKSSQFIPLGGTEFLSVSGGVPSNNSYPPGPPKAPKWQIQPFFAFCWSYLDQIFSHFIPWTLGNVFVRELHNHEVVALNPGPLKKCEKGTFGSFSPITLVSIIRIPQFLFYFIP